MRANHRTLVCYVIAICALAVTETQAAQIPIAGYDINDAVLSGHGGWAHTYSGTITPSGVFFNNFGFPGETATYSGVGNGTLTDGIIGNSTGDTQLFVSPQASDGTPINPAIFFTLPSAFTISSIEIYGGDINNNSIPGTITGVTVSLLDTSFQLHSQAFTTTAFGPGTNALGQPVNALADLTSSSLAGVGAFTVELSDFQGGLDNWFSITEVKIFGDAFVATPEPSSLVMIAGCLLCGVAWIGHKRWLGRRQPMTAGLAE